MRRPLLLIFPAYCVGILIADYLPLPLWLFFLWGAASVFVAACAVYRQWLLAPYFTVGVVILAGLIRMSAVSVLPEHFIVRFVQDPPLRVEGVIDKVLGSWVEGEGKLRTVYIVDVKQVINLSGRHKADGKIRLTVRHARKQPLCQIGDRISVLGKLRLPRPGSNPGDLDYRAYFLRRGIGAAMHSSGEDVHIMEQASWYHPLRKMHQLRENLGNNMTRNMGAMEAAMLKGLVFGERVSIPAWIEWDFADTGLVHILSVSGYHVALIAGVVYAVLRFINCAETFVVKATMLCVGCYVLLVGFSPPVLRSALMAVILLGAMLLLRKKDALQALLVAGWVLLLWDPRQIYDIGFQLSFGATAGLIMLSPGVTGLFNKYMPAWAATIIAATISATLAVLPLLANYFQQVSIMALPANLLLTFPVSLLIISGMLGALLGSIWSPLAHSVIVFNDWLTGIIIQATHLLAGASLSTIHISVFPWWLVIAYYMLLAWSCQLYQPAFLPDVMHLWKNLRSRVIFLGVCVAFSLVWYVYAGVDQGLVVTFLNVGQGDAAFIRTPHGRSILIDGGAGSREDGTGYDTGEKIIMPFLRREGVRALDFVILSHGHEDHAGGLRTVLRYLPVKGVLTLADHRSMCRPPLAELLEICSARKIPVFQPVEGEKIHIDGISLEVLTPGEIAGNDDDTNEASIVVRISYGEHHFLFAGDLEGEAEQKLSQAKDKLLSTVLKVGHHGSGKGTLSAFLDEVNPAFAVISVGEANPYGHPAPAVLQRLQDRHVRLYRTDQDGAVSFWSDGRHMEVQTYMQK